jgi:hypothetical protein
MPEFSLSFSVASSSGADCFCFAIFVHKVPRLSVKTPFPPELRNIYLSRDIKSVSELYGQTIYFEKISSFNTNMLPLNEDFSLVPLPYRFSVPESNWSRSGVPCFNMRVTVRHRTLRSKHKCLYRWHSVSPENPGAGQVYGNNLCGRSVLGCISGSSLFSRARL